jgi:hypothetical protein
MNATEKFCMLENFIKKTRDDPRITAVHVSLYVALLYLLNDHAHLLQAFSYEVMPVCKISGSATYHRCIRDLDEFGYINYFPSFNHFKRSRVEFVL